jgi:hypothetical protein
MTGQNNEDFENKRKDKGTAGGQAGGNQPGQSDFQNTDMEADKSQPNSYSLPKGAGDIEDDTDEL